MIKYDEIHPTLRRFFGGWEVFRKLGFPADELFCQVERSVILGGRYGCFIRLQSQGLEFTVECGLVGADPNGFLADYSRISKAINEHQVEQAALDRMHQESEPYQKIADLVLALKSKGFRVPDPRGSS